MREAESRLLSNALRDLLQDFEPKLAVPYMVSKQIFNDDQQDSVLSLTTRRERVYKFIWHYRRSAPNLDSLVEFFRQNGQNHLAEILSTTKIQFDQQKILSETDIQSRLLHESNVPSRLKNYIRREALFENLSSQLKKLASEEQFWLVVYGMAGSGKSTLVADVLYGCPELLSRYYQHIIWVNDGRRTVDSLCSLYADFFVTISDSTQITGHESMAVINSQVKMALIDRPNALIVLDDVVLEESVRYFDRLSCRILATTRNLEIFQAAHSGVRPFPMLPNGFLITELISFVTKQMQNSQTIPLDLLQRLQKHSAGLPAMINIILNLARNNTERLADLCYRLERGPLGSLKCITSYRYSSMDDALQASYEMLSHSSRDILVSLAVFPVDEWLPLELIALVIPMDEIDAADVDGSVYRAQESLETLAKHCFIDERYEKYVDEMGGNRGCFEYRIHPLVGCFIRRTLIKQRCFIEELRALLLNRISSFMQEINDERLRKRFRTFYENLLVNDESLNESSQLNEDMMMMIEDKDHHRINFTPLNNRLISVQTKSGSSTFEGGSSNSSSAHTSNINRKEKRKWYEDCLLM